MAPSKSTLKRKASAAYEDAAVLSDDEFGGVTLDGVLDGESDDDDEDFTDNDDQDDSEVSGSEDEDENDDLASDDVPSDGEGAERKKDTNGAFDDDDKLGPNYTVETDANGGTRYVYKDIDPIYDSDDSDANEGANTIGDIPLSFYDSYPHIGYTIDGKKIMRPAAGDALDNLLDSIEVPKGWTGLTDPQTGKPLNLSQDELELLRKLQMGEIPSEGYDPYPDTVEWFTSQVEEMPLSAAPEPKRRFLPSKHEQKRIMKLVKAIKEGRIQPYKEPKKDGEEEEDDDDLLAYGKLYFIPISYSVKHVTNNPQLDLWADEKPQAPHIMNIPAPKLAPPGYDLSYNPPPEYLPDEEERKKWEGLEPEEREKEYLPQRYDSLRKTPAYDTFVKERFERCLDLYLAPRVRKNRLNIDPSSLLPKLPRPEEVSSRHYPIACAYFMANQTRIHSAPSFPYSSRGRVRRSRRPCPLSRSRSDRRVARVRRRRWHRPRLGPPGRQAAVAGQAQQRRARRDGALAAWAGRFGARRRRGRGHLPHDPQLQQQQPGARAGQPRRPRRRLRLRHGRQAAHHGDGRPQGPSRQMGASRSPARGRGRPLESHGPRPDPHAPVAQEGRLFLHRLADGPAQLRRHPHAEQAPHADPLPEAPRARAGGAVPPHSAFILRRDPAHDQVLRPAAPGARQGRSAGCPLDLELRRPPWRRQPRRRLLRPQAAVARA